MRIYGDKRSGNCYKLQLLLSLLGKTCEWVDVDIMKGETRSPSFLEKSPNGKIPLLELDDGRVLSESNAIMHYLASNTPFVPSSPYHFAQLLQWQFFEQYSHEPYIAVARYIAKFEGLPEHRQAEYAAKQNGGHKALKVMEQQLELSTFLVGETLSVADIALYAYTHVAHEGGFSLRDYPYIQAWLLRISNHPNYVGMEP